MKVILINCNELDLQHNHTPYFYNGDKQLNWFMNKPHIILDDTKEIKANMNEIYESLYKIYNL